MTLKVFEKCDPNYDWYAYIRVGLYYVTTSGQRNNFCDIHLWGLPEQMPAHGGVFTGPKDSAKDMKSLSRSKEAIKRYDTSGVVHPTLGLVAGGKAHPRRSRDNKALDVWMFGPLLFEGAAYGSLIAHLDGFQTIQHRHRFENVDKKTGKTRETSDPKRNRFDIFFAKDFGASFMPCKLWGSKYSKGEDPRTGLSLKETLEHEMTPNCNKGDCEDRLLSLPFPKNVTKVVWKAEEFGGNFTICQLYEKKG